MTRLCFGIFARVLSLCKRLGVTDPELVGGMTKTVDPDCEYISKPSRVSNLLSCKNNLSNGAKRRVEQIKDMNTKNKEDNIAYIMTNRLSGVIELARTANKTDVRKKFVSDVIPLLDSDLKEEIVLALKYIIANDNSIEEEHYDSFKELLGTTKEALLSQGECCFSELLTGVFLYTVVCVSNTVGKKFVADVYTNDTENNRRYRFADSYLELFAQKKGSVKFVDDLSNDNEDQLRNSGLNVKEHTFDFRKNLSFNHINESSLAKSIQARNKKLDANLVAWIKMLPAVWSNFDDWIVTLLDAKQDSILEAFSLFTSDSELEGIKTVMKSKSPVFSPMQQAITDRFQLFLGGLHGLTQSNNVSSELSGYRGYIGDLRRMIKRFSLVTHRSVRDVYTTLKLINSGDLSKLRTTEIDFELWFVLKSIQEFGSHANNFALKQLVNYVERIVTSDSCAFGTRIADRRHSWWAINTLANYVELLNDCECINRYIEVLLRSPLDITSEEAAKLTILPENVRGLIKLWELVNIIEILQLDNIETIISHDVLLNLQTSKISLSTEMVNQNLPTDIRTSTVEYRAGLTYLRLQENGLWGKNI